MHITCLYHLSSLAPTVCGYEVKVLKAQYQTTIARINGPYARVLESPVLVRSSIVPPASLLLLGDRVFGMFFAPFQRRNFSDDYT